MMNDKQGKQEKVLCIFEDKGLEIKHLQSYENGVLVEDYMNFISNEMKIGFDNLEKEYSLVNLSDGSSKYVYINQDLHKAIAAYVKAFWDTDYEQTIRHSS